jgi:glyoxylase-like metal-dependent hydrolase (beta-lactamase superfamily II)
MTEQVQVGNVSIMAVPDALLGGSPSFMYPRVPAEAFEPWRHYQNPRGNLRITIGTFVVRTDGKTVLVDTGLGEKQRPGYPQGTMLDNLRDAGVTPEDVDLVLITHLHLDHVGWNTVERDGTRVPTFPNARYVIVRDEWEFFTTTEPQRDLEYVQECVLPLEGTGQLDLVEGTHTVTRDLTFVPAPGHSPAHSCLAIVSNGDRAMIIGDLAHHPIQLTETAWEVWADMDPKRARETRERMVERLDGEGGLVIGGHFPAPGFGRLVTAEGRRVWQAV